MGRALIYTVSWYACTRCAPGVVRAAGAGLLHEAREVLGQLGPHVELGPLVSLQRGIVWEIFLHFLRLQTTLNTRV